MNNQNVKKLSEKELKKVINKILLELAIATNTQGFNYLLEGIYLAYNNRNLMLSIVKGLYAKISDKFGNTYTTIERTIRYSIERAYTYGDLKNYKGIFGNTVLYHKDKPTNSQFISAIVNYLDLNL